MSSIERLEKFHNEIDLDQVSIFPIQNFHLTKAQQFKKRTADLTVSLLGIFLTLPIMAIVAAVIKIEDGGKVFYKQVRLGLNGKEFQILKFRSMIPDAEKYTGAVFAVSDDPRITKTGKFIRATRIDELPQFFNVLEGSMSVVGPRPERPIFVKEFSQQIPDYKDRLTVKPGITGLAQVMGNYRTTAKNKSKFDLMYIRNYSFLLDIKIMLKTLKVIFSKEKVVVSMGTETNNGEVVNLEV